MTEPVAYGDLSGLAENFARASGQDFRAAAASLVDSYATQTASLAQSFAPVKTGALKDAITIQRPDPLTAIIGPTRVSYAIYQEFGTASRGEFGGSVYEIRPKKPGGMLKFTGQRPDRVRPLGQASGHPAPSLHAPGVRAHRHPVRAVTGPAGWKLCQVWPVRPVLPTHPGEGLMRTQVVPTPLYRRYMTQVMLNQMATTGQPVGDATSPIEGGWQGQPNADGSNFKPYVVLTPGPASVSDGPFGDTQADWQLGYTITSFGVSREQCEWMADTARVAALTLARTTVMLNGDSYAVQQVREQVLGPVQRVDATEPAYFGQTDTLQIWISKELF